jgi:hypothetical protein
MSLLAAHQTTHDRDVRCAATLLLLLLLATTQHLGERTQAETTEQLVDTKAAQEAVDKATKTKPIEQPANQVQHTRQQQANGSDDLEKRLGEQAPERVELLLGMRHVGNLLLRVVDGGDDSSGNLLEAIGKTILLGRGLASLAAALGLRGDAAIGVETAERAVAFLEDATSLFDERLDVVDKLLLIELVAGCAVSLLNVLDAC